MPSIPEEFTINVVGETTGETWRGVFKAKPRLTHKDLLLQDQMRRDLLGPKPAEASANAQASSTVFAKIWSHLTDAPTWWKSASNGLDLEDESPVVAVLDGIRKIEEASSKALQARAEAAKGELKKDAAKE